jgi:hypothetical protein
MAVMWGGGGVMAMFISFGLVGWWVGGLVGVLVLYPSVWWGYWYYTLMGHKCKFFTFMAGMAGMGSAPEPPTRVKGLNSLIAR